MGGKEEGALVLELNRTKLDDELMALIEIVTDEGLRQTQRVCHRARGLIQEAL